MKKPDRRPVRAARVSSLATLATCTGGAPISSIAPDKSEANAESIK